MKKQLQKSLVCMFYVLLLTFSVDSVAQNIFSGEPVQVVGQFNGYVTTPYNSDYRTTGYRRVSTPSETPTDGRGQWATTMNAQSSGGNFTPINMSGGGGNGFLFISGPSTNRFQNKWVFSGVGQGTVGAINGISAFNSGNDMGLNMSTAGRYTFVFNDCGYTQTNAKYYVGYTANDPVTVSRASQSYSGTQPVIAITTSAAPSAGENIYVRYRVGTNDFTSSTSIVQATGSGTSWSATLPSQSCGTTLYYYVYTSTRTLSQINADSETDRSLAVLRYDDSFGANFSTTLPAATVYYQDLDADGFGNPSATQLSCTGAPSGYVTDNSDCNDSVTYYTDIDGDSFGALPKLACGSITNNTDCNDNQIQYQDNDGDGFGSTVAVACGVTNSSDCNDNQLQYQDADGDSFGNPAVLVGCGATNNSDCNDNQIQYQDLDNDGFGSTVAVACGVTNSSDCNDNQLQYQDADGDSFGNPAVLVGCGATNDSDCNDNQIQYQDLDNDGFGSTVAVACGVTNSADCNDNQLQYQDADGDSFGNPLVLVGCGATNNSDCNDNQIQYQDNDGDGFGSTVAVACGVTNSSDCNDNQLQYLDADGDAFGSTTLVGCGVANNSDCNDNQIQYQDNDGDGFGSTVAVACGVTNSSDCNDNQLQYLDADGDAFGSTTLVGCGVANNSDCNDNQIQYQDNDGDGFGSTVAVACGVTNSSDCNDNQLQYLDADGDAFGSTTLVGCGVANNSDCNDNQIQYQDNDGDGFGNLAVVVACGVTNSFDCNDNQLQYQDADGDSFGNPAVLVGCGVANNADCNDNQIQYQDLDNDGFGNLAVIVACGVTNSFDCNDNQLQYQDADGDSFGNPAVLVGCGVANNTDCNDNQIQYQDLDNDGFGNLAVLVACGVTNSFDCNDNVTYYTDNDGDGFGTLPKIACGTVTNSTDCNDGDISVWQSGTFYVDVDGDNYSPTPTTTQTLCYGATEPVGYSLALHSEVDCNDANAAIYPGATEICYNNILENCSGTLSQGCAPVVVNMTSSYNNTTLASLATAIPAVAYAYPGASNIKYRFSIKNVTTNVTSADIIQTSRYVTIPAALHLYGAVYDIKVSAVINDEVVAYAGNTIRVNGPTVQLITLNSATCGSTLATLASTITANAGLNATGYTFRIRLNDSNPTPTYYTSPSVTRFVSANSFTGFPLQYSTSYKVSVQYTFTDPVTSLPVDSGYGAECTVNTPSIPLTGLASPTCGSTVTALNANISASAASYATSYQFRIRLFSDNGPTPTYYYSVPNASRFSSLTAFQGITLAYNTAYSISVQYSVLNGATTVWSGYGAECKVTTPFFPTTSLVPSQCGLLTPTSLTQQLNITPYPGFPNYKVKLDEVSGEDIVNSEEIIVTYSYFRLNQFSIAQAGKNYNVSVAIKLNGVFGDYSTACDLFTAPLAKTNVTIPFKATAYPNPFANNFMLDIKTNSQSAVNVKVYDMVGRLIEQRNVTVSDMATATIGDQYPSGVYNVVVSQEDSVETVRVVKR